MISLILLVFALVLFIIAGAFRWTVPADPWGYRLTNFGLACWVGAQLVTAAMSVH